jgi:putative transposase
MVPGPKRIFYPNACYHVFNRGISKKTIFFSEWHRDYFLSLLDQIATLFQVEILGYCIMSNHYHILIRTPLGNLDKAMHYFGSNFSKKINRDLNADGPLFRDRYKALLIDTSRYLLQVSRYIHLNPVEAQLAPSPEDYEWSSYLSYTQHSPPRSDTFLKKDLILAYFKHPDDYVYFVQQGIDKDTQAFYSNKKKASIIGSPEFIQKFR